MVGYLGLLIQQVFGKLGAKWPITINFGNIFN